MDFEKHPIPGWFDSWFKEHYEFVTEGDLWASAGARPYVACRRCGQEVWHLTKHAHNVHGDDIEVLPTTPHHVAKGMHSDDQGRLVQV